MLLTSFVSEVIYEVLQSKWISSIECVSRWSSSFTNTSNGSSEYVLCRQSKSHTRG
ncbi:hypothetical protein MICAG_1870007 [Microcystis aeruginosa PCC 9808]|uniref:Uncharacterized protein n=1 Tax=Microcystis aeruginosa PCC 9808 TaxID=1160284 RepID=I4HLE9_MICAE|nr:hypothetical protein MICAG_1870007 [Microcystis aeruginosa PCC 9808]